MSPAEQDLQEARHIGKQLLAEAVAKGLPLVLARIAFREYLMGRGFSWPGDYLRFASEGQFSDADLSPKEWLEPWPTARHRARNCPTVH